MALNSAEAFGEVVKKFFKDNERSMFSSYIDGARTIFEADNRIKMIFANGEEILFNDESFIRLDIIDFVLKVTIESPQGEKKYQEYRFIEISRKYAPDE